MIIFGFSICSLWIILMNLINQKWLINVCLPCCQRKNAKPVYFCEQFGPLGLMAEEVDYFC